MNHPANYKGCEKYKLLFKLKFPKYRSEANRTSFNKSSIHFGKPYAQATQSSSNTNNNNINLNTSWVTHYLRIVVWNANGLGKDRLEVQYFFKEHMI